MGIDVKNRISWSCFGWSQSKTIRTGLHVFFPFYIGYLSSFPVKDFSSPVVRSAVLIAQCSRLSKQETKAQNESIKQALLQDVYKGKS
jgi:hypothetical protein